MHRDKKQISDCQGLRLEVGVGSGFLPGPGFPFGETKKFWNETVVMIT